MAHIDSTYETQFKKFAQEEQECKKLWDKKRRIKFTVAGLDGVVLTYERTDCIYPYMQDLSFQYIADYFATGKWANERDGYVPVVQEIAGRKANAFADAMMIFQNLVIQQAVGIVARRCVDNPELAATVINTAAEIAKTRDEYGKKQWQKLRRQLKDHEKKGKSLWADFCGIIGEYKLYTLSSFEYADA